MKIKKMLCLALSFIIVSAASGCKNNYYISGNENTEHSVPDEAAASMQLLYCASDSFNPYTAQTSINREICKLMFDSLYKTDNSFSAQPLLAISAENEGTVCRVIIRNAVFSDGSAVTAADVVYSCKLAMNTAGAYASLMYEVTSVFAENENTVVFKLIHRDPYFTNMLTFPIIKSGSDSITDTDGVVQQPVGCGRFVLSENESLLYRNSAYYGNFSSVSEIRLINAPDTESVEHYVEIGATDAYYTDMSDGKIVRMSGKKTDINLNNLVYIGINNSSQLLSSSELRYAVSSAIDRTAVCKTAYYDNALAATGFFHPEFADTSAVQTIQKSANTQIALENLEKIGYNKLDKEGYRINSNGKRLILTLLVNSENASRKAAASLIASQLKVIGIELRIIEKSFEQYSAALSAGSFELYIGEVLIPANMDISELVIPGGSAAYGITDKEKSRSEDAEPGTEENSAAGEENAEQLESASISEIFEAFYAGDSGIQDIAAALLTELPCIPICYREGLLFYDDGVCNLSGASVCDIFLSLDS